MFELQFKLLDYTVTQRYEKERHQLDQPAAKRGDGHGRRAIALVTLGGKNLEQEVVVPAGSFACTPQRTFRFVLLEQAQREATEHRHVLPCVAFADSRLVFSPPRLGENPRSLAISCPPWLENQTVKGINYQETLFPETPASLL